MKKNITFSVFLFLIVSFSYSQKSTDNQGNYKS